MLWLCQLTTGTASATKCKQSLSNYPARGQKVALAVQKELQSAERSHTNIDASNKCTVRGKAWQCQSQGDYSCLFFYTSNSKLFRKCKELESVQCQRSRLNKPFLSLKKIMKYCLFLSKGSFSFSSIIYSLFPSSSKAGAE